MEAVYQGLVGQACYTFYMGFNPAPSIRDDAAAG